MDQKVVSNIRSHFLVALASTNVTMLITFVSSLFISRLLTPHEIGIFSIAYVLAGLLRTIREMGLGSYIVQEQELTTTRFRTAFGISILVSIVTGSIVAALAGPAANFYHEPGIEDAMYVIAATFILVPFGATTLSVMRRELRFKRIALIEIISTLLQASSAVFFAWWGLGFMSLAWSTLFSTACTVAIVAWFRPSTLPWLPALTEWRRVLRFSGFISGSSLVSYFNSSASDLILGRLLNIESVAFFNRARSLSDMLGPVLIGAAQKVSLPYYSELLRSGNSALPAFLRASNIYNSVAIPAYAVICILADSTITVLFGQQWGDSVVPLQALCIASIISSPATLSNQILIASGNVRLQFKIDLECLIIKLILIIISAPFGLAAVAWSYALSSFITTTLRLLPIHQHFGASLADLWGTLKYTPTITLICILGPVISITISDNNWSIIIAGYMGAIACFILGLFVFDSPIKSEVQSFIFGKINLKQ
jgi:O-antigen/teichoic acid export membrane protein